MQIINTKYLSFLIVWGLLYVIKYTYYIEFIDIVNNENYMLFKEISYYNTIVSYVALCNIIDMMFYINIFYLYIRLLSKIIIDIETIIDFHLLYGLIYICSIYRLITLDFSLQMWLGIFGCLYIRNIYVKLLNLE